MAFLPDARTQLAGVVGHPVAHSLSPSIQNTALRHEGRNAVYLAFDVAPSLFGPFVGGVRAGGVRGLNVTLPHKAAAFEIAGERSPDAEATRAVNVLLFEGDRIEGHNTDVAGVRRALAELGVPEGARAMVIGAGGAGRAAVRALAGSSELSVTNRTPSRAERLAAQVGGTPVPWAYVAAAARSVDVVVHATSLGLGADDAPALSAEDLRSAAEGGCQWLLDLVYGPGETSLVLAARTAGITATDGLTMLVHQGAEAYRLLWGADAPLEVMRGAALSAAERLGGPAE